MDELIVWLCLTLGWTFDEAHTFATKTSIKKVNAFVEELQYQKAIEDYRIASNFAVIVATMASSKQRKYKVTDIIGQPPTRKVSLKKAADKAGIKMPEE
jgi:hypothetical protein